MIVWSLFYSKDTKLLETKEINFLNFLLTVTEKKKLTDSRKTANILADNRKNHHLIETLE